MNTNEQSQCTDEDTSCDDTSCDDTSCNDDTSLTKWFVGSVYLTFIWSFFVTLTLVSWNDTNIIMFSVFFTIIFGIGPIILLYLIVVKGILAKIKECFYHSKLCGIKNTCCGSWENV